MIAVIFALFDTLTVTRPVYEEAMCVWLYLNRGPPRFEGERRFGDRDGYRGGPRGPGGDFGDKGGAPADYRPSFGVCLIAALFCIYRIEIVFFFFLNYLYLFMCQDPFFPLFFTMLFLLLFVFMLCFSFWLSNCHYCFFTANLAFPVFVWLYCLFL